MYKLTLQGYCASGWRDVMELRFQEPERGLLGTCSWAYTHDYLIDKLEHLGARDGQAVSIAYPVGWEAWRINHAPAFLFDLLPAGAARRFLLKRLTERPENLDVDLFLLSRCTPAPVGHLRIKESAAMLADVPRLGFARSEVVERDARFLEYAYEQGAAIGGATGAGGEAPKLLLTEDREGLLHPDAALPDECAARHWFVKFARNRGSENDQTILRSEYAYYRALQALGFDTVAADGLALEHATKPSLWMHRFDRAVTTKGVRRLAVESVYSVCGIVEAGSYQQHTDVVRTLARLWRDMGQGQAVEQLVVEYLVRDLLNQVLGNSDNHGRNTSIVRDEHGVRLAPIYDLAPMVMDDEGITRTTKWPRSIEVAGQVDWKAACSELGDLVDPDRMFEQLRNQAQRLLALPDTLSDIGLPEATFQHPRIALNRLPATLAAWGLV
ncbi:type II toxin-antitoxin system HipA family toxin [Stutzerimonas urumqiensis]|uniref:type II toxin-antitoxin system HipA family toxin n=1 Tax=Stutzerimonas urumqiensis TaxID=638269 RepID=UPI003BAACC54